MSQNAGRGRPFFAASFWRFCKGFGAVPIYAYRCSACGHAQDVLQKMSDPVLTVCPECGQSAFAKQVTAAGFQLKGSGWYVTDFRNGGKSGGASAAGDSASGSSGSASSSSPAGSSSSSAGSDA